MGNRICSIEACDRSIEARGWCKAHYGRWKKHGDVQAHKPLGVSRALLNSLTVDERFWLKVDATGDCWTWTGAHKSSGYGSFWNGEKSVLAHRYSYKTLVGGIPEGLELDHLCRVRDCVNPDHLEPVPAVVNVRRGAAGRAGKTWTHCRYGHEYAEENTRYGKNRDGSTFRICKACEKRRAPAKVAADRERRHAARRQAV